MIFFSVPSQNNSGHTTFWVRIIRQTVTLESKEQINRILVVIWPLFILRSVLPMSTAALEEETQKVYQIFGRGEIKELNMSGSDTDLHQLEFDAKYYLLYISNY
jgi:vacuolar protein sorting-associated protein 13B